MAGLVPSTRVQAQASSDGAIEFSMGVASQERRRGISWSDGKPVAKASLHVPVSGGLYVEGAATTLANSRRHNRADGVVDMTAGISRDAGMARLSGEVIYHQFIGAAHSSYVELGAGASTTFGPALLDMFARYAPSQSAIGGDMLYLGAGAQTGIPGTPLNLSAQIGHSTGSGSADPARLRLRPERSYTDYSFGIDYTKRNWMIGLRYSDTDISAPAARHVGRSLVASVTLFP
jgi:uncharacterized protein (TIGR02001 family)